MNKYILLAFVLMGVGFYELSGGDDFVPRKADLIAEARAKAAAQADRVAAQKTAPAPKAETVASVEKVVFTPPQPQPQPQPQAAAQPEPATAPAQFVQTAETAPEPEAPQVTLISLEQSGTLVAQPINRLVAEASRVETPPSAYQPLRLDIREIAGSRVNMREGPGTEFGVLTSLTQGTEVEVIDTNGDGWVKMRTLDDQQVGWMAEYLLSEPAG